MTWVYLNLTRFCFSVPSYAKNLNKNVAMERNMYRLEEHSRRECVEIPGILVVLQKIFSKNTSFWFSRNLEAMYIAACHRLGKTNREVAKTNLVPSASFHYKSNAKNDQKLLWGRGCCENFMTTMRKRTIRNITMEVGKTSLIKAFVRTIENLWTGEGFE